MFNRKLSVFSNGMIAIVMSFAIATLGGCANAPSTFRELPGVRTLVDAGQLMTVSDALLKDKVIASSDLDDMKRRPLPNAPTRGFTSMEFEAALLRRIAGAMLSGDSRLTRETYELATRHSVRPPFSDHIDLIYLGGIAAEGKLAEVNRTGVMLEQKYRALARSRGVREEHWPSLFPSTTMIYNLMLQVANFSGASDRFAALMTNYPDHFDHLPHVSIEVKTTYATFRGTQHLLRALLEGDFELVETTVVTTRKTLHQRINAISEADRHYWQGFLSLLDDIEVEAIARRGRFETARSILLQQRERIGGRSDFLAMRPLRAGVFLAESSGDYEQAIKELDLAWGRQPWWLKNFAVAEYDFRERRMALLVARGFHVEALAEWGKIERIGRVDLPLLTSRLGQHLALAETLGGRRPTNLEALETLLPLHPKQSMSLETRYFHSVRTIAYSSLYERSGNARDAQRAIESGRQFADVHRRLKAANISTRAVVSPFVAKRAAEAYLRAAALAIDRGFGKWDDLLDALSIADDSEADEAVSAHVARSSTLSGIDATQLRGLQDSQRSVREMAARLEAMATSGNQEDRVRRQEADLERARLELERRVASLAPTVPRLAAVLARSAPTLAVVRQALAQDEALLIVRPLGSSTLVVVISRSQQRIHLARLPEAELGRMASNILRSLSINTMDGTPEHPFDLDTSERLYEELIRWAEHSLTNIRQLNVVTSGPMAATPFGALIRKPAIRGQINYRNIDWLIRTYAVSQAPTVSSWVTLRQQRHPTTPRRQSFVAWADPAFGSRDPACATGRGVRGAVGGLQDRPTGVVPAVDQVPYWGDVLTCLPETRDEALQVARLLSADETRDLHFGDRASRRSVIEASNSGLLASKQIVLFATHGVGAKQLLARGLSQPALALAMDPNDSMSPFLKLDDILSLRLNADWVILSACDTASGDDWDGRALSGLARGFFFAGSRAMLVTLWAVNSESAGAFTIGTIGAYVRDSKLNKAQAVQRTSMTFIEGRVGGAEWAHPAHWAAFSLVGDARRH